MYRITFHCRTISPMFLSGADSDQPELRAPSIKGALRFWARAISLGWPFGNDGSQDHRRLLQQDEALFGGVTTGVQKSKVSIHVRNNRFETVTGPGVNLKQGGEYLWYSLIVKGYQQERKGIAANEPFAVILQSSDETALNKAIAAFWILAHFGAIGTRARRGAGAFQVILSQGHKLPENLTFKLGKDPTKSLKKGLMSAQRIFGVSSGSVHSKEYSTLGRIWVSKEMVNWEDAINDIGQLMYKHRKAIPNPNPARRKFTMATLDQKAAFGLPVKVQLDNSVNFSDTFSRRSSPIWISLIESKGKVHWVVSELQGKLTPDGVGIEFHSENPDVTGPKDHYWPDANSRLLSSFFQKLDTNATKINFS